MPEWIEELDEARDGRFPGVVLVFNTQDRVFVENEQPIRLSLDYFLALHLTRSGFSVARVSAGTGLQPMIPPKDLMPDRDVPSPFPTVSAGTEISSVIHSLSQLFLTARSPLALIVDFAENLVPPSSGAGVSSPAREMILEMLVTLARDERVRSRGHLLVLISNDVSVHPLLGQSGRFRVISIDLPDTRSRDGFARDLARDLVAAGDEPASILESDLDFEEFARITGGLRLIDLESLLCTASTRGKPVSRSRVRDAKGRSIRSLSNGLIQVQDPRGGFSEVAGAFHAKTYFRRLKSLWTRGAGNVPQGILLSGVPGCGKSHLVQALAHELETPLLVMRGIRESLVGASERNLDRALWVTENLSPCILWTDEIDQAIGRRSSMPSGDSGTSERMTARMFEFFGSMAHRGRIIWVATTNRPDLLDPALLDRFQVVIPFVHPGPREREELLPCLARQLGRELAEDVDCREVASRPKLEGLTARSIQEILAAAASRGHREDEGTGARIDRESLDQAVADYMPMHDRSHHELMALEAIRATSFASLLPWTQGTGNPVDSWPPYLDSVVNRETGRPDPEAISRRIRELRQHLGQP